MSDLKKLEEVMKKLSNSIPTVHFNGNAFKAGVKAAMNRDETIPKLELISGMTIEELAEKFAAGWTLYPPEINKYKFDDYILQCQLDDIAKAECDNEIRGYYHFGFSNEPLIPTQGIVKLKFEDDVEIDFDKKPEESDE